MIDESCHVALLCGIYHIVLVYLEQVTTSYPGCLISLLSGVGIAELLVNVCISRPYLSSATEECITSPTYSIITSSAAMFSIANKPQPWISDFENCRCFLGAYKISIAKLLGKLICIICTVNLCNII